MSPGFQIILNQRFVWEALFLSMAKLKNTQLSAVERRGVERRVTPLPYTPRPNHITRRLLNDVAAGNKPPMAKKVKHEMEMFGDVRSDNYYWLRDENRSDPNVLSYINEENNYTDLIMSSTKYLQDQIYAEMRGKIKEDDITAPRRRGPYYYYESTLVGKQYYQYCRRLVLNDGEEPSVYDVMPTGPNTPPEHVILDVNVRAQGHANYSTGTFKVSPNHKLVAFTEDTEADQIYTAYVIDAESGKPVGKSLTGLAYNVVWAGNISLLYVTMDETHQQDKVWLHKLGEEQSNDLCLYHEKDEKFSVDIEASKSNKYVFVGSQSSNTRFIFYFDIENPQYGLIPLTPRLDGTETSVSHSGTYFFIKRRSDEWFNSELLACPVDNISAITTILPHRERVKITYMQLFSDHLVVFERENGLAKVIIFNLPPLGEPIQVLKSAKEVEFMDPAYSVYPSDSDFFSSILRFVYTTLKTPQTIFDYDMNTGTSVIKRIETVLGGFDSSNYFTERKWATAPDGVQIPMSIVYRKDLVKLDRSNPLLLFGYGSYGLSRDPRFETSRLSLLDRGFIYVIAHVRGGGEMGSQWSENGKLLKKKNTFSDFIACAEYLIDMNYSAKQKLVIDGAGAGGLLITAVLNMRPGLFKVAVVNAPIVDVVTTLLDTTIPDITSEWEEWGDPHKEDFYNYIKSYSPLDNVSAQKYPSILVTTRQIYPRLYSNSAKYVAKLRDVKIDDNLLLFKCEIGSSVWSGRFESLKEDAFVFTFILKALDMIG